MICLNCGTKNPPDRKFCSNCGALLSQSLDAVRMSLELDVRKKSGGGGDAWEIRIFGRRARLGRRERIGGGLAAVAAALAVFLLWKSNSSGGREDGVEGSPRDAAALYCDALKNKGSDGLFRLVPAHALSRLGGPEGLKKKWSLDPGSLYARVPLAVRRCSPVEVREIECDERFLIALKEKPYSLAPGDVRRCASADFRLNLKKGGESGEVHLEDAYLLVEMKGRWFIPEAAERPNGRMDRDAYPEAAPAGDGDAAADGRLKALRSEADAAAEGGDWAKAASLYGIAFRVRSSSPSLARRAARACRMAGESDRAAYYFDRYAGLAGPLTPTDDAAAYRRGWEKRRDETGGEGAFLGVTAEKTAGGLIALRALSFGSGEVLGVKKGDRLERIGERYVYSPREIGDAMTGLRTGDRIDIQADRGGDLIAFRGTLAPKPSCDEAWRLYDARFGAPSIGSPAAARTAVLFLDARCENCRAPFRAVRRLAARPENPLRFVYAHQSSGSAHSDRMYAIAECAGRAGRFWEALDVEYDLGRNAGPRDVLSRMGAIAKDPSFVRCVDGEDFSERLQAARDVAYYCGSKGPPSVILDGRAASFQELEKSASR